MAPRTAADDSSLKRLGGGRWQTRDERFTIEPQSGTWVVVDAEQTDDLGLPLVRGPFRSLGDSREAIAAARSSPPEASPLAGRIGRRGAEAADRAEAARVSGSAAGPDTERSRPRAARPSLGKRSKPTAERDAPHDSAEPRWLAALEPETRRQARRLISRLEAAGAPDPEGLARRDVVGEIPAVAAFAIGRRLDALRPDAGPADVAGLLADGRDDDLGVRWRLVDDAGRPITIETRKRKAAPGG
jgi:hypothetical protein